MYNKINETLFYFQGRECPAPLNIPTPTLAPDRGGPVACLRVFICLLGDLSALFVVFVVFRFCMFWHLLAFLGSFFVIIGLNWLINTLELLSILFSVS